MHTFRHFGREKFVIDDVDKYYITANLTSKLCNYLKVFTCGG